MAADLTSSLHPEQPCMCSAKPARLGPSSGLPLIPLAAKLLRNGIMSENTAQSRLRAPSRRKLGLVGFSTISGCMAVFLPGGVRTSHFRDAAVQASTKSG